MMELPNQAIFGRKATLIALIVSTAFFMQNLDGTVIATALPQIAISFHTSAVRLNIGMTAYLITLAVFIPISGWVADRFGTRNVFAIAIGIFSLASLLCAGCQNVEQFTLARIFQGVGGSMMTPVGRLAVLKNTPKSGLVKAIAYITWPGLVAPIIGPPLGGFITTFASWHWIFLLNVPMGIIGLVLVLKFVPNQYEPPRPLDFLGFILSGFSLSGLMYGIDLVSRSEVPFWVTTLVILFSLLLGWLSLLHSRHARSPILDPSVLKFFTFSVTIVSGTISRVVIGVAPFLVPLLFQVGFGLNAFVSGMLVLSSAAGNFGMRFTTIWMTRKFGFRKLMINNEILLSLTTMVTGLLVPSTPIVLIVMLMFIAGTCRSIQFSALNTLAFVDIPKTTLSSASSLYSTVQQVANGLGIAIGALILHVVSSMNLRHSTGIYSLRDFHFSFLIAGLIGLLALPGYCHLKKDAGSNVSGHH